MTTEEECQKIITEYARELRVLGLFHQEFADDLEFGVGDEKMIRIRNALNDQVIRCDAAKAKMETFMKEHADEDPFAGMTL